MEPAVHQQPRVVTLYNVASPELGCQVNGDADQCEKGYHVHGDSGPDQWETMSVSMSFTTEDNVDDDSSAPPPLKIRPPVADDRRLWKHRRSSSSERHQRRNKSRSRLCPRCSNNAQMGYYGEESIPRHCSIPSSHMSLSVPPMYWTHPLDVIDTRRRHCCGSPCYAYVLLLINLMTVGCIIFIVTFSMCT